MFILLWQGYKFCWIPRSGIKIEGSLVADSGQYPFRGIFKENKTQTS
jgi:hypothetical protein